VGYILTRPSSPDSPLIEACAKYIATQAHDPHAGGGAKKAPAASESLNEVRNALMRAISTMTATTPEDWRALAAAADNAAAHDGACGDHAAAMIFVMQCSLLGKRKRIREQTQHVADPSSLSPLIPAPPPQETPIPEKNSVITAPSPPPLPEPDKPSASKKIVDQFRLACERAFAAQPAPATLPEKIRQHEAMAALHDPSWASLAAWLHIMESSPAPGLGRLHATA